jgi:hypothetical protein
MSSSVYPGCTIGVFVSMPGYGDDAVGHGFAKVLDFNCARRWRPAS